MTLIYLHNSLTLYALLISCLISLCLCATFRPKKPLIIFWIFIAAVFLIFAFVSLSIAAFLILSKSATLGPFEIRVSSKGNFPDLYTIGPDLLNCSSNVKLLGDFSYYDSLFDSIVERKSSNDIISSSNETLGVF